jgi:hypothetical protein
MPRGAGHPEPMKMMARACVTDRAGGCRGPGHRTLRAFQKPLLSSGPSLNIILRFEKNDHRIRAAGPENFAENADRTGGCGSTTGRRRTRASSFATRPAGGPSDGIENAGCVVRDDSAPGTRGRGAGCATATQPTPPARPRRPVPPTAPSGFLRPGYSEGERAAGVRRGREEKKRRAREAKKPSPPGRGWPKAG